MTSNPRFMRTNLIGVERTEKLPPDDKRTSEWFARLGYSVPEAVADLVDNSIDANAKNLLIRLVRSDDSILRVVVVDDGDGMDENILREAMRFGGGTPKTDGKLGKYGIGLKAASLSQAKTVIVLSIQRGHKIGRRWTTKNIGEGWISEILNGRDVARFISSNKYDPVKVQHHGTIVIWEDLVHLQTTQHTIDSTVDRTIYEISTEMGWKFHRFISPRRVRMIVDAQMAGHKVSMLQTDVSALDPFSYDNSGKAGYPMPFIIQFPQHGKLKLDCHIWPPKSNEPGYKLGGGKVSARQGFYFYRNDRLIQAGGWNQCRDDDTEPHLSLARVRIELPSAMDSAFKLDVKKSKVEPPPEFHKLVNSATSRNSCFRDYINDAQSIYRKQKVKEGALFKHMPGSGFPTEARRAAKRILWEKGTGKPHFVHFKWASLDPDVFVELDRDENRLFLNDLYRDHVLQNKRASGADAPLIKLLLLLLFQDEFEHHKSSAKYREWSEKINHAIIAMLKKQV